MCTHILHMKYYLQILSMKYYPSYMKYKHAKYHREI